MPLLRCQIGLVYDEQKPKDTIVNTVYLNHSIGFDLNSVDGDQLADDLIDVWRGNPYIARGVRSTCKIYDMGHSKPREPIAERSKNESGTPGGPRETALCLSFFSERNLPRRRGRLYIGPFASSGFSGQRPSNVVMEAVRNMGIALGNVGGANVTWRVYSPTSGQHHKVTDIWVDNEWDTVRSRGLGGTTRIKQSISN